MVEMSKEELDAKMREVLARNDLNSLVIDKLNNFNTTGDSGLDVAASIVLDWVSEEDIEIKDVKFELFECYLSAVCGGKKWSDLILYANSDDSYFIQLLGDIYPAVDIQKHLKGSTSVVSYNDLTIKFSTAVVSLLWRLLEDVTTKRGFSCNDVLGCIKSTGVEVDKLFCPIAEGLFKPVALRSITSETLDLELSNLLVHLFDAYVHLRDVDKREKSTKELLETKAVDEDDVMDNDYDYTMEINSTVDDILLVYDSLYASCYQNKPLGVLTSEGVLFINDAGKIDRMALGRDSAKKVYDSLSSFSGRYLPTVTSEKSIDSSFFSKKGTLTDTYSPIFHLYNIFGLADNGEIVQSWQEYKVKLQVKVIEVVGKLINKYGTDSAVLLAIKELFCNCIIVYDFDTTKAIRMNYSIGPVGVGFGKYLDDNKRTILGKTMGAIINDSMDATRVVSFLYVFNTDAYTSEILFSYKAYKGLKSKASSSHLLIGRLLNGTDMYANFEDDIRKAIGIFGGSRSGKGVVTLNILAGLISSGCPVMYLDFKPDMAGTLWELERDLTSSGLDCKIFAIDGSVDRRRDGTVPVRSYPYGTNKPSWLDIADSALSIIPYVKAVQFACVLANLRATGYLPSEEKVFFILDELNQLNVAYGAVLNALDSAISTAKKAKSPNEEADRVLDIMFNDLKTSISSMLNTYAGSGRVALIAVGQELNAAKWQLSGRGVWMSQPFGSIVAKIDYKLVGPNAGSGKYVRPTKRVNGDEFLGERGYFLNYTGNPIADDCNDHTVVKTFLTLNKNDFDKAAYDRGSLSKEGFTGSLIDNISKETDKQKLIREDLMDGNKIRQTIGFAGLMKEISKLTDKELAFNLSKGYVIMNSLFESMGLNEKYSCVEEYLYDCAADSFFKNAELIEMAKGGKNAAQRTGGGSAGKDDGDDPFAALNRGNSTTAEEISVGNANYAGVSGKKRTPNAMEEKAVGFANDEYKDDYDYVDNDDEDDDDVDGYSSQDTRNTSWQSSNQSYSEPQGGGSEQTNNASKNAMFDKCEEIRNKVPKGCNVYTDELDIEYSPFVSSKWYNRYYGVQVMSEEILKDMVKVVGDLGRVSNLGFTGNGIVVNKVMYRPSFSEEFLNTLPLDMQLSVRSGDLCELFYFGHLKKFKNLVSLEVESVDLAEGRMRRELHFGRTTSWSVLFSRFRYLKQVKIAGKNISDKEDNKRYKDEVASSFSLRDTLAGALGVGRVLSGPGKAIWNSGPVRLMGKAAGYTGASYIALAAAMALGPWGLVFAGFTGYGMLKGRDKK